MRHGCDMERNRDGNDTHRRARRSTPLGALVRGFAGGAFGVACFDTVQFLHYRLGGGEARAIDWELSRGLTWADAPAPAQVGRRAVEGIFRIELPDRRASLANNLVHWGYGIAWGEPVRARCRVGREAAVEARTRLWHARPADRLRDPAAGQALSSLVDL